MDFDYQAWLYEKFADIIRRLEIKVTFKLSEEQESISDKNKQPDVLYIVYKQMVGPTSFNVKSVPYQILVMSEENQLEFAKAICNKFVEENNFATTYVNDTLIKHAYSQPSVLSNFNQVDVGVRSIVYILGTLQVMSGLKLLTSDGNNNYGVINVNKTGWTNAIPIKYLAIAFNYSMVGDTQQMDDSELATTIKSTATATLSFTIPLYDNDFCGDILDIMQGTLAGDTTYTFSFYLGSKSISLSMKCISAQLDDAPDQAPGLKVGFML